MRLLRSEVPPVYPLTATVEGMTPADVLEQLVEGGARWIQLREKGRADAALLRMAREGAASLPAFVRLWINDRTDIALAAGADGVHLGEDDLPPAIARQVAGDQLLIGYSTHSVEEALAAAADAAIDYLAIGPIFRSSTKDVRRPLGVDIVRRLREQVEKPIIAIGGIDAGNIASVLRAGADSAAVIAAVYDKGTIVENLQRLIDAAGGAA